MMIRTLLVVVLVFSVGLAAVHAQDGTEVVGIDTLCGDAALEFVSAEAPAEDAQTLALDEVMRKFVTLPGPDETPLSMLGNKPPAPGAVVLVDTPGGRYFKAIGVADVATCEPLQPTMRFPIGSNTKMFTAAAIYQLQEEGLLSTEDLVSDYLPEEIGLFEGAEPITIDMLLAHTSGLPDYLNSQSPTSIGVLDMDPTSGELEVAFTPEELVANAAEDEPLLFQPGADGQWAYSNTGYIMLGQIIEQVAGKSYNEVITERIIEPLGLQNTVPVAGALPAELGVPSQYMISPFTWETSGWNFSQAWSAGNIVSSAEDMAVFLRALYSGKLFQSPETLDAMLTRAAPGFAQESDNYHYMHGGFYKHGFLGHGGQTLGTISDVGYHPQYDIVIITWANSAEALTSQLYHVGQALGVTPSLDEALGEIFFGPSAEAPAEVPTHTLTDVVGLTLTLSSYYRSSDKQLVQVPAGSPYTVQLAEDGTMTILADCNTVFASYTAGAENALSIEIGPSTLAACPPGSLADEYLALLGTADAAIVAEQEGSLLLIIGTSDGSTLTFLPAE